MLGPALLLLVFVVVQAGLWFYARSLALAAAQEGVDAGRAHGSSPRAGIERAEGFLSRSAGDSLHDVQISAAGSTAALVRIEVSGRSLSVLPGVAGLPVSQAAQGPTEVFTRASP